MRTGVFCVKTGKVNPPPNRRAVKPKVFTVLGVKPMLGMKSTLKIILCDFLDMSNLWLEVLNAYTN